MKAYSLIRPQPHYRSDAFLAGLKAAGYEIVSGNPQGRPGDVLLTWNRYSTNEQIADRFEADGGTVIVSENGYVGPGGISPHDMKPREIYALAIGGHNGSGRWNTDGGPERWEALGVELKPWRTDGDHILVLPNRSFGMRGGIMPQDWPQSVTERLRRVTKRPVRVRAHPGNDAPKTPLNEDLKDCWAVIIWNSSAGVQALINGIPVFQCAPHWICTSAASLNLAMIEDPACDDYRRLASMQRLAAAQWTYKELESGEPFRHLLLSDPREKEGAVAV